MILQPISEAFSCFSDVNHEMVDIDWEDDTDKEEKEDKNEEDKKIEPQFVNTKDSHLNLFHYNFPYYIQQQRLSHSLEILIPPPKLS
jgi:hypothetical protein